MSKWKCTYKGKQVDLYNGKLGPSAPSWHTFDRRTWQKGNKKVVLSNLTNLSREAGDPREYWITRDKNGQERMVTRYAVVVFYPPENPCKIVGSDWQALVNTGKQIADGYLTFEQWMLDETDSEILKVLEHYGSFGAKLHDVCHGLRRNLWKPDKQLVQKRLAWLADHGFVYHVGKVGTGTRWRIA